MSQERLRIAFVYDALFPYVKGGAERRVHELARRLAERHEVHLVSWTWWDGRPDPSLDGQTLHGVGAPPAMYGADGKRTVREVAAFSARVMPVLMRNRWDVIDCSATPYLPLASTWIASRLTGTRLVVTWHEFWGDHWLEYLPHRPVVARLARALEGVSRRLGDEVVAVSGFTARAMNRPAAVVTVVPNGITLSEIESAPMPPESEEVVYVGRLIDEKRVDLLIEAAAALRDQVPSVRVGIIGTGPQTAALAGLAERLCVADRVTFHGQLDPSAAYGRLKAAKLLVLPSIREGFGMAVAEAQAAGTVPIVVRSPWNAATGLIRDGVDGFVVEPSAEGLAGGIRAALADRQRLSSMASAARQAGATRDWDQLSAQMETIYRGAGIVTERVPGMEGV